MLEDCNADQLNGKIDCSFKKKRNSNLPTSTRSPDIEKPQSQTRDVKL